MKPTKVLVGIGLFLLGIGLFALVVPDDHPVVLALPVLFLVFIPIVVTIVRRSEEKRTSKSLLTTVKTLLVIMLIGGMIVAVLSTPAFDVLLSQVLFRLFY